MTLVVMCIVFRLDTSAQFGSIESIEYDSVNGRFLVSNGNNVQIADNDGNAAGQFGTAPRADYGMEVMGNALFTIINNGIIRAYDLTSGEQISTITIPGTNFLNGMASNGENLVWVTDFGAKKIYEIDFSNMLSPQYTQIVSNTVTTPNGICYDGDNSRLVFVNWSGNAKIKAVSLPDYTVTTLVENTGLANIDGIDNDAYGNFYISSWGAPANPKITKYNNDFSLSEVITVLGLSSPADICYAQEIDTLAIPNSGNQTVKYVGFETPSSVQESVENPFGFSCYPNPVTDKSVLYFKLKQASVVRIEILDSIGRSVGLLLEENLSATSHKIVIGELDLSAGIYMWRISDGTSSYVLPFVK